MLDERRGRRFAAATAVLAVFAAVAAITTLIMSLPLQVRSDGLLLGLMAGPPTVAVTIAFADHFGARLANLFGRRTRGQFLRERKASSGRA
jgi:hypothetical protein